MLSFAASGLPAPLSPIGFVSGVLYLACTRSLIHLYPEFYIWVCTRIYIYRYQKFDIFVLGVLHMPPPRGAAADGEVAHYLLRGLRLARAALPCHAAGSRERGTSPCQLTREI